MSTSNSIKKDKKEKPKSGVNIVYRKKSIDNGDLSRHINKSLKDTKNNTLPVTNLPLIKETKQKIIPPTIKEKKEKQKENFIANVSNIKSKQNKLDQISIKQELEWQRQEIKIVKGQIKAKRQDLVNKENEWINGKLYAK